MPRSRRQWGVAPRSTRRSRLATKVVEATCPESEARIARRVRLLFRGRRVRLAFRGSLNGRASFKTEAMEEKRKHPRTEIDEPAYVSSGGSVMSCVVRNISADGAAIEVENPAFVPAQFRLVMARDSSVRGCRVIWIQKNRIGLSFVED